MDPASALEKLDEYQFVDVRKAYEWEAGHVPGAKHITLQELPARIQELVPDIPAVFTCQIGQRSAIATRFARERGFEAYNLEGGVERWRAERLPLVTASGDPGEVVDGWAETLEW
jgi:rhodanese-related sulfurtransferase